MCSKLTLILFYVYGNSNLAYIITNPDVFKSLFQQ